MSVLIPAARKRIKYSSAGSTTTSSRVKVGTRRLSERMSTVRPVQYEAPGANRSSRNSCHLYSRRTKRTLYSHSLLRFLQVFSHLVVRCFIPAPSALGIWRTTSFSSKRSSVDSIQVWFHLAMESLEHLSLAVLIRPAVFNQFFHRDSCSAAISRIRQESHFLPLRRLTRKSVRLTGFTLLESLRGSLGI